MVSLGFVVVLIGTAADVAAQADNSALLTSAASLQEASQHEAARVLLREAFARTPTPRIAGQLAISELALGQYRDAEVHFAEALASSDEWVALHRAQLADGLRDAAAQLGTIDTSRLPPGTAIRIGDTIMGYAPTALRWASGSIELRVRTGDVEAPVTLEVVAGQIAVLEPPARSGTPATHRDPIRAAATLAFPESMRRRFAASGMPREPLSLSAWTEPEWALDVEFVIVARGGAGVFVRPAEAFLESDCGFDDAVFPVPRFAVGAGLQVGLGLPSVFFARAFGSLQTLSGCEHEDLPDDPVSFSVTRTHDGWLIGLNVEAGLRYTPRRNWYLGIGAEVGLGFYAHDVHIVRHNRSAAEPWQLSDDSEITVEALWKGFLEVGFNFGSEGDWSGGVRVGGGMPTLASLELELVVPLAEL